ncbi:hypothetical protein [Hydrogenophaga sp.]|uniref:hypothetical protein n=1 Tax=Hydrogenophaga sp. TaxID=1904254 RepID=UPI00169BA9BC|nr:hypothetical protein [Hydrogenophaga sp.]NIU63148.1 hypothetical protein [Stutzerimonas stutzeri]NIM40579.1 hypothetical protein [Hydrogenophaga sp.]NIN30869.1 hypothetical protein [Hydrogenophaga sp.]NIO51002.1 hypothetical protein [Hydrogenophaga sp.]NIO89208.1 hypothetical protein [Hydrogenophaga sp.]
MYAAPVAVTPPTPQLTYLGRVLSPDGSLSVLVQWEDGSLATLKQGQEVGQGFVVERLGDASVELVHPSTHAVIQLLLPPEPSFETR